MQFERLLAATAVAGLGAQVALADTINFATGGVGGAAEFLAEIIKIFEERTGHTVNVTTMPAATNEQFAQYRVWLAGQSSDIDVFMADVIWAPQLADNLLDLTEAAADVIGDHFPSVVESQTVDGRLVAIPVYTAAPALFYRMDLLEKYGLDVPETWDELTETA